MDGPSISDALDQALARLAQGASLEEAMQPFPAYAAQLRPLLAVSVALWQLANAPQPALASARMAPEWATLLTAIPQQSPPLSYNQSKVHIRSRTSRVAHAFATRRHQPTRPCELKERVVEESD
jgi:hypothetical protein